MSLSKAEQAAGRRFRDEQAYSLRLLNDRNPPDARCSPYSPLWFRHECSKGRAGTTALHLRPSVASSPQYWAFRPQSGENLWTAAKYSGDTRTGLNGTAVPAGRFGFTYLEGFCRACGFTVRSGTGYLTVKEDSGG